MPSSGPMLPVSSHTRASSEGYYLSSGFPTSFGAQAVSSEVPSLSITLESGRVALISVERIVSVAVPFSVSGLLTVLISLLDLVAKWGERLLSCYALYGGI